VYISGTQSGIETALLSEGHKADIVVVFGNGVAQLLRSIPSNTECKADRSSVESAREGKNFIK
jgi:hypothetical protein